MSEVPGEPEHADQETAAGPGYQMPAAAAATTAFDLSTGTSSQLPDAAASAPLVRSNLSSASDSGSLGWALGFPSSSESSHAPDLISQQTLLVWSMQHQQLVEVELGLQPENSVWYTFPGRPWAPSEPILAVLSSGVSDYPDPRDPGAVIRVLDFRGRELVSVRFPAYWLLSWAPDSSKLAAGCADQVVVLDVASGTSRSIEMPGYGVAWAPNSQHLVCCPASAGALYFLDSQPTTLQLVARAEAHVGTVAELAWLGDCIVAVAEQRTVVFEVTEGFGVTEKQAIPVSFADHPVIMLAGGHIAVAGTSGAAAYGRPHPIIAQSSTGRVVSCQDFYHPSYQGSGPAEYRWASSRFSLVLTSKSNMFRGEGFLQYEIRFLEEP